MNITVIAIKPLLYILVTEEPMMSIQEINRKPMLTDMAICNTNMELDSTGKKKQHCYYHSLSRVVVLHLCQRSFYKIFVKFRNSKKNVLKIVLIIVNINKDGNKSLISNQFSLKNDLRSFLTF